MEVDPSDDNFYDDLASFMPPPGDYNLDDIDEILRFTDSQLDSSIDLNSLNAQNGTCFDMAMFEQSSQQGIGKMVSPSDITFSYELPSLASVESADTSSRSPASYTTQRTSSISSMDECSYKTNDFMNTFDIHNIKAEDVTMDNIIEIPLRNTPSPTGSCASSSGSSTSGIQSDASDSAMHRLLSHNSSADAENEMENEHESEFANTAIKQEESNATFDGREIKIEEGCSTAFDQQFQTFDSNSSTSTFTTPATPTTFSGSAIVTTPTSVTTVPLTLPVVQSGTIIQSLTPMQSINVLLPLKTVPLNSVTNVKTVKPQMPLNLGPKIAPKTMATMTAPSSASTASSTTPKASQPIKILTTGKKIESGKLSSPPNSKPKTIYLSSGDFKALMQKMNGKNGKTGVTAAGKLGSGQAPIIITKTANGKVITTNKILTAVDGLPAKSNFVTKSTKTAPMIIKHQQQQQQQQQQQLPQKTLDLTAIQSKQDLSIFKGIIDEKMLKKQQRMIKNRESASLSRKKKKEYVMSLESRISDLEKENCTLKGENSSLRSQLVAFAQTCHCKHGNVSEFILNSLNANTREHVKIAPKPPGQHGKGIKPRLVAPGTKKNMALLFAMALMVTLNMGNFKNCFNKNSLESVLEQSVDEEPVAVGSRRLLWVETEKEFNEKSNVGVNNNSKAQMDVPPLHFLRPVNHTKGNIPPHVNDSNDGPMPPLPSLQPPLVTAKCSSASNANFTENMRLASNLHKWIGGNDYLNLSKHGKFGNDLDDSFGFKVTPEYLKMNSIELPYPSHGPVQKRKIIMKGPEFEAKQPKLEILVDNNDKPTDKHSLELFKPKIRDEYARLFKSIKRRDDTFYVLSFNMDHILLSASAYNKSARPKMSLMLPAGLPTLNGDVVLMQIDCEVVNTTELGVKSDVIPEKLRPSKNFNFNPNAPRPSDVANNETMEGQRRQSLHNRTGGIEKVGRGKPPVRTYLRGSGVSRKREVTLSKLDNSVVVDSLKLGNSTLFSKMRETVGHDDNGSSMEAKRSRVGQN